VRETTRGQSESRQDPGRAFESAILASAPKGLLPEAALPRGLLDNPLRP